ncbi:MAG: glycerophosphodiester phosphodiesterase [Promethearchaeota archaeon]|nr:MAG: glycerophosphodiester phosphodiesterase [Candidatus Lokiarchaeota archaeon]
MNQNRIYIFGHRGASGYCIENTLESFKTAFKMNAHIETDVRLTKDNVLVAFHDPGFKINGKYYKIKNLTYEDLKNIDFKDGRNIPTLEDLFNCFPYKSTLKFSIDIGNKKVGFELIDFAKKHEKLENIFITDTRIYVLEALRDYNVDVNLIYTVPYKIVKLEKDKIDIQTLKRLGINTLNIKANKFYEENFSIAVKCGFNCFFWSVNTKMRMKRLIKMEFNGSRINGLYTDYPDQAIKICDKILNRN